MRLPTTKCAVRLRRPRFGALDRNKMKNRIINQMALVISVIFLSQHAVASTNLFSSVQQTKDLLTLTLPSDGIHWMITVTLDKVYRSDYGQRLSLTNGQAITLSDRHVSHDIRAVITQNRAGLDVTTTEDMRSFGGTVTQRTFFVKAPKRNEEGQPTNPPYSSPRETQGSKR